MNHDRDVTARLLSPSLLLDNTVECTASTDLSPLSNSDSKLNSTLLQSSRLSTSTGPLLTSSSLAAQSAAPLIINTPLTSCVSVAPLPLANGASVEPNRLPAPRRLFTALVPSSIADATTTVLDRLPTFRSLAALDIPACLSKRSALPPANSAKRISKHLRHRSSLTPPDVNNPSTSFRESSEGAHFLNSVNIIEYNMSSHPEWFAAFLVEYRRDRDNANEKFELEFENLNKRMDSFDAQVKALNQRLDQHGEKIKELNQQHDVVTSKQQ